MSICFTPTQAAAASKGVERGPVRLAVRERNEGSFSSFIGYATDADGRKYKVTYEPVDPAARPARMSSAWISNDDDVEADEVLAALAAQREAAQAAGEA